MEGENLLKELYRKKEKLKLPNYIIGFTQYEEETDFSPIWKVITYTPSSGTWKNAFQKLILHINSTHNLNLKDYKSNKPTIFVEGTTDLHYLNHSLDIFFSSFKGKFDILSQKSAGANWVANQLAIWAIAKKKYNKGGYIPAVGLLDSDIAGNDAKSKLKKRIQTDNENNCFKILQINQGFSKELIEFYKNGLKIEIEIESLFPIDILKYADDKGWLEHRASSFIVPPPAWNQFEQNSKDYILSRGIDKEKLVILKKVKREHKEDFCKYVLNCQNQKEVFKNFKAILKDLLEMLSLK